MNRYVRWVGLSCQLALLCAFSGEPKREVVTVCGERVELMTPEEVKAAGFPWVDVPPEENAATWYLRGASALHAQREDQKVKSQRQHAQQNGWDDGMRELAEAIQAASAGLDCFRRGASKERCQFPYQKTKEPFGVALPGSREMSKACWLLAAEARRFEAKGKSREAVDNYLTIFRIGSHYGRARMPVEHLLGESAFLTAGDWAFKGIYRSTYPRSELVRFLKALGELRGRCPDLADALEGEKARVRASMDDIMRLGPAAMAAGVPLPDLERESPLKLRAYRIFWPDRTIADDMSRFYDRCIACARGTYRRSAFSQRKLLEGSKPWNPLASLLYSVIEVRLSGAPYCEARVEMLRLTVALKIFADETGSYPDRLDRILEKGYVTELPADPFSGEPFRYKVGEGEYVLYSVGENGTDDGGVSVDGDKPSRPSDFGFRSALPPPVKYEHPSEGEDSDA